jgi:hypothetical protein
MSDPGVVALAGAVIGGLSGYGVAWRQGKATERAAEAGKRERQGEVRRTTYISFLTKCDLLADKLRELQGYATPPAWDEPIAAGYSASWSSAMEAKAAVEIIGPSTVTEAGRKFFEALTDNCNLIDAWIDGKPWTEEDEKAFLANMERRKRERQGFIDQACVTHDV